MNTCEEWEKGQPTQTCWFRKNRTNVGNTGRSVNGSAFQQNRKPITCYACGKGGHVSRECRSRPPGEAVTGAKTDITCFRCKAKGHKSPDCPTRPKGNRRVQLPSREPLELQEEELFGAIGDCQLSITVDTGAQISVVPKECVRPDQLTGEQRKVRSFQGLLVEGEACKGQFTLGGKVFNREAVAIAGDLLNWTPCFRVPLTPRSELEFVMDLAEKRRKEEGAHLYVPPKLHQGKLLSGYLVSGESGVADRETTSENTPTEEPSRVVEVVNDDVTSVEEECASLGAIDMSDNK